MHLLLYVVYSPYNRFIAKSRPKLFVSNFVYIYLNYDSLLKTINPVLILSFFIRASIPLQESTLIIYYTTFMYRSDDFFMLKLHLFIIILLHSLNSWVIQVLLFYFFAKGTTDGKDLTGFHKYLVTFHTGNFLQIYDNPLINL